MDGQGATPLSGWRVVVTRAESQADALGQLLRAAGAEPIVYPTIDFAPPADSSALDDALRALAAKHYHWLLLTSATGVRFVAARLQALAIEPAALGATRLAAVGSATARAIETQLLQPVACVPERFVAEELAQALGDVAGARLLIAAADIARPTLPELLRAADAEVDVVVAYRTLPATGGPDMPALLRAGAVDVLTFASPSALRSFLARIGPQALDDARRVLVACIGPITAAAAREAGLPPQIVAEPATMEGLVAALAQAASLARASGVKP